MVNSLAGGWEKAAAEKPRSSTPSTMRVLHEYTDAIGPPPSSQQYSSVRFRRLIFWRQRRTNASAKFHFVSCDSLTNHLLLSCQPSTSRARNQFPHRTTAYLGWT